jgi:hypothetical protein
MNGQTSDVDALDAGANSGPTASEPSGVEAGPASTNLIPVFPIALPRLPQNCVREVDYADAQSCGLHTSCDDYDANNVDCAVYDDGTWGCACTTNHYSYEFSVSGAEGAAACEVASEACGKGDRHDTSQPVTCDLTSPNPDADYCYMTQDCTRSVALDSEVSLSFSAEHSIYCAGTEGAVTCECGDDPSLPGVDFQLSSTNAADGCELTAALCSADVIAFDGPKDCKDPEVGSDGDCDITRECKQWNEDESIAVTTHDSALCSSAQDGSWSCECDTRDYTLSFGFAVPANLDDQCHTALDVCADAKQIELLPEPARCLDYELTAQAEEGTGCDGRLTCERDASFGDQGIVVYGDIQIACVPVGANGWRCSCYTPVRSVDVTIGTPMVRSDACSLAAEQCPRVIDAQFGITSKLPQENMPI